MSVPRVRQTSAYRGIALLLCLLGGCMNHGVPGAFEAPALFLADYQSSPPPPSNDKDQKTLASAESTLPQPRPLQVGRHLTLADVIKEALDNDLKIRAAAEIVNQAGADLWTASLVPNPTLTTSGTLLPLTRPFTVEEQGGPPQFDVGVSFPLAWLLWGQRNTAMNTARTGVDVAVADFADLVRQRVAGAVNAYFDVLEAKALVDLTREDLETLRRLEDITKDRVKIGGVGAIEADRIRLSVLDSERELIRKEATLKSARAALQAQLGRLQVDPTFDVQGSLAVGVAAAPIPFEAALNLAEQYRPDLVSLRWQVTKAEAVWQQENTKACPEVTPRVGFTRQFQQHTIGFPDASSYGVGVDVVLPLFDRNQGNISKARSIVQQNQYNLQSQQAQLRGELAQVLEDFRTAYLAVIGDAPERLKTARNLRDRIEAAYKAGGRPLVEVLDAQRAYRDSLRTITLDQSAYWHALFRLNATIGRQVLR